MQESMRGPFESASIPDSYRRFLQPVIFDPWAVRLIDFVDLRVGQDVLDVAAGTGAVARAAARVVGPTGRVIASDISTGMLANIPIDTDSSTADTSATRIELLESSAIAIDLPDAVVDIALCQQGFPFIPNREAAAREMHRVLRPGGTIGVAVWAAGRRLEPFDSYGEVLIDAGFDTPFIRGSASGRMSMSETEVREVLLAGGFADVEVELQELVLQWPSIEAAAAGVSGTPYWPVISSLEPARREELMNTLREIFTGSDGQPIRQTSIAVLGRGTASS